MKASLTTPDASGQIHMVLGITQESPDDPGRSVTQECAVSVGGGAGKRFGFCFSTFGSHLYFGDDVKVLIRTSHSYRF